MRETRDERDKREERREMRGEPCASRRFLCVVEPELGHYLA